MKKSNLLIMLMILFSITCYRSIKPITSQGGILIVNNKSSEPFDVFIQGQWAGEVAHESQRKFIGISLGKNAVDGKGRKSSRIIMMNFDFSEIKPVRWVIEQQQEKVSEEKEAGLGSITIKNRSGEPVILLIDGSAGESLWNNADKTLQNIKAGKHTVEARSTFSGFSASAQLSVNPSSETIFFIPPPKGSIKIINGSPDKLMVSIGNTLGESVNPKESIVVSNLELGKYELYAIGPRQRGKLKMTVEILASKMNEVTLKPPSGTLAVLNLTKHNVEVFYENKKLGIVKPDNGVHYNDLNTGLATLYAVVENGVIIDKTEITVNDIAPVLWEIKGKYRGPKLGDLPSLMVNNQSGEPLLIRIDKLEYGRVEDSAVKIFPKISEGRHSVRAVGVHTSGIYGAELIFEGNASTEWIVYPLTAKLTIKNLKNEDVRIFVGSKYFTTVRKFEESEKEQTSAGLNTATIYVPVGHRIIEARGIDSLDLVTAEFDIKPDNIYEFVVQDPSCSITIKNTLAELIEVIFNDTLVGKYFPMQSITIKSQEVCKGTLTARSLKFNVSWVKKVNLNRGESIIWEAGK